MSKTFSQTEFFRLSLEQYFLLKSATLSIALSDEPHSEGEKRKAIEDFLCEFCQFASTVMGKASQKHSGILVAEIFERLVVLDFTQLRNKTDNLHRTTHNRPLKQLILSLPRLEIHLLQLFTRLNCLKLMYEYLTVVEKVPKGCNYREKFETDITKHLDQLKVIGEMQLSDSISVEDLCLSLFKRLLANCACVEFLTFLNNLSIRNDLSKHIRRFIRSENEQLTTKFAVVSSDKNSTAAVVALKSPHFQPILGSSPSNSICFDAILKKPVAVLCEKENNNQLPSTNFSVAFSEAIPTSYSKKKSEINIPSWNADTAKKEMEEEGEAENENGQQPFMKESASLEAAAQIAETCEKKRKMKRGGGAVKKVSAFVFEEHNMHPEEDTRFNLICVETTDKAKNSNNNQSSVVKEGHDILTNNRPESGIRHFKFLCESTSSVTTGNGGGGGKEEVKNTSRLSGNVKQSLSTNSQRQITNPILSGGGGRTMYSLLNKKIVLNSSTTGKSNTHQKTSAQNVIYETASKVYQERQDVSKRQSQLRLVSRESSVKQLLPDQHQTDHQHKSQITHKTVVQEQPSKESTPQPPQLLNDEENSLPLMFMWGHH